MTGEMPTVKLSTAMLTSVVEGSVSTTAFGSDDNFTHVAADGTPISSITLSCTDGRPVKYFLLTDLQYELDVNGGTHTYTLSLFEDNQADDIQNSFDMIFTDASKNEATRYVEDPNGDQLPRIVKLADLNTLWYLVTWSQVLASSNRGYIKVKGRPLNTRA